MGKTKWILKIIFFFFAFTTVNIYSRTRSEVISEAEVYSRYEWRCSSNNILDINPQG